MFPMRKVMTECERFIQEKKFNSEFFREEIRNGFLVSSDRKKVWAVSLDLLMQLDKVCKKHGLTYYLFFGSLLGVVRHKGFIPWDDDIDVVMPRKDYEIFSSLGAEFPEPYFLQTPWTDPGYYYSFAKLRNSRTSFVSKMFQYEKFNQGIMIDIFPLDEWLVEDGKGEAVFNEISALAYDNSTFMRMSNPTLDENNQKRVCAYKGMNPLSACEKMRCLGMSFSGHGSEWLCQSAISVYKYSKNIFLKSDFSSTVDASFEGVPVMIPSGYDNILKTIYGDYNKLPPVGNRGCWHSGTILDPDNSYTKYVFKGEGESL